MVYGQDLIGPRPGINIHQNRVRNFATFLATITSNVGQKCLFSDRSTGHLEVRSTYLGWTTGFNSDGVFTMESCSPHFCRLNFTLIVTFVRQFGYHLPQDHPLLHFIAARRVKARVFELSSSSFFIFLSSEHKILICRCPNYRKVSLLVCGLMEKSTRTRLNSEDSV